MTGDQVARCQGFDKHVTGDRVVTRVTGVHVTFIEVADIAGGQI